MKAIQHVVWFIASLILAVVAFSAVSHWWSQGMFDVANPKPVAAPLIKKSYQQMLAQAVKGSDPFPVTVGHWNYLVLFSTWRNGRLVVNFSLTNRGPHSMRVPAMRLGDTTGATHTALPDEYLLSRVNPGIAMALEAEFLVPEDRDFALMAGSGLTTRVIKIQPVEGVQE